MKIEVRNRCNEFDSYRTARVKSMFNAESGASFDLDAELPIEDMQWKIGVVVGPAGSGKTSIGEGSGGRARYTAPVAGRRTRQSLRRSLRTLHSMT